MVDPDLQIKGGGAGLQKKLFRPFGLQFALIISGGPGPSPGSATASEVNSDAYKFQREEDLFTTQCLVKTILIEGLFRYVSKLGR